MPGQKLFISLLTLGLLTLLPGAALATGSGTSPPSAAEVKTQIDEALKAIASYSADQRDAAMAKADKALKATDASIRQLQDKLDNNWDSMSAEARKKARAALESLQQQRTKLAEWYGGLKHSSAGAWKEIKKGFANSYRDLEKAFDKARQAY